MGHRGQKHVRSKPMVRARQKSTMGRTMGRTVWEKRLVRLRRGKARGLDEC